MQPKVIVHKLAQFNGHLNSIYALGSGSKNIFYTGANDGFIVEWNLLEPDKGKLLVKVNRPVYSFLFLPEHNYLLAGTAQGNLHVIDLKQHKEIKNIEAHHNGIFDIAMFNNFILTAGGDGLLNVWDDQLKLVHSISLSEKSARVIAVNKQHNCFAVGYSDYCIRIFNDAFELTNILQHHTNSVFSLCYNKNFNLLFSGGRDAMLNTYNVDNNYNLIQKIPAHTLHINAIALNPKGNLFATVSMDKTIKIWHAENQVLLKVIDFARNKSHTNSVNKIIWLNDDSFVTCSDDKTAMAWQIELVQ